MELKFASGLLAPILAGKKLNTLRKYRSEAHQFSSGDIVEANFFEDGVTLSLRILKDTYVCRASDVSDADVQDNGYANSGDMMIGMRDFYPDFGPETLVAIIRFEPIKDERFNNAVLSDFPAK